MNKIAIASVLAVLTGLAGAPQTAQARDDKVLAAIGGFIGGVLIASAVQDHHSPQHAYCEFDSCTDRYVAGHRHGHDRYGHDRHAVNRHGRDRYDWVTVRVWVPGRTVIRYDSCGNRIRHYERGHYVYRKEYVVVDSHRGRGHGRRS